MSCSGCGKLGVDTQGHSNKLRRERQGTMTEANRRWLRALEGTEPDAFHEELEKHAHPCEHCLKLKGAEDALKRAMRELTEARDSVEVHSRERSHAQEVANRYRMKYKGLERVVRELVETGEGVVDRTIIQDREFVVHIDWALVDRLADALAKAKEVLGE